MTEYNEPFLDYNDLTLFLQKKGLTGSRQAIEQKLRDVGYKRLSAYWSLFLDKNTQKIDCDIDTLWGLYCFDRRLRFLILDAIERIEVGVRSRLVHYFTAKYGAYGHLDEANFPTYAQIIWRKWLDRQLLQTKKSKRSRGTAASVFFDHYSSEYLPLWVLCELMDFGSTVTLFGLVEKDIQSQVSKELNLPSPNILQSWLTALNDVRNACAHHEKVWNRQWAKRPQLPKQDKSWRAQFDSISSSWVLGEANESSFKDNWIGILLTICNYMLKQLASSSHWNERLLALLNEDSLQSCSLENMGLHQQWLKHPLWKN